MKSRDFCYWLQGLFELAEPSTLDEKQVQTIRNHLNMVFYYEVDPSYGGKDVQDALNDLHSGGPVARPFSHLTESFSPERRERIEQQKEHLRQLHRP